MISGINHAGRPPPVVCLYTGSRAVGFVVTLT